MVKSAVEDVAGKKSRQGNMIKRAEEFYYRRVLRGDSVVKCLVLKKLELMANRMKRWGAESKMETSFDKAQRKKTAQLQKEVETVAGPLAAPKTVSTKNKSREKN